MSRVDYSELVVALQDGDEFKANELLEEVMPRLIEYLEVVMKAEPATAKECAQQAFLDVFEQIRKENIKENKYIFSYLIKATRNEYVRYTKHEHRFVSDPEEISRVADSAEQIEALMEQDRMRLLEECLDELERSNKVFIEYFIDNPDKSTKDASRYFDLTGANVRTKKSRIISILHNCFKYKSSL